VADVEEGGWVCVATSVEELESLGADLALSAKGANQELSSLVGAAHKVSSRLHRPHGSCCP
jgi:hypothetical protein